MRDLVRGEIVEHERRRQNEAPGERKHAGARAGAPSARLVADGDPLDCNPEVGAVTRARGFQRTPRLTLEEIGDAAGKMRRPARGPQQPGAPPLRPRPPPPPPTAPRPTPCGGNPAGAGCGGAHHATVLRSRAQTAPPRAAA